ncbi:hypothetical protein DH2020_041047 [Rehmannia glutinosa]|uniref:Uncharacterized protein n=1 Tax=Rehmannia glutinosa TaxID=99300 RepID=A0ABR0URA9_REHGL
MDGNETHSEPASFHMILDAGDALASDPQLCNEFINSTVTINVCKTKCYKHYRGWGICVSPGTLAPPPALLQPTKLQKPGKKCYRCKCTFHKKPNQPCPSKKPAATIFLTKA